jgi:ribosome-binding protein aMBF1 (putative translation factor)
MMSLDTNIGIYAHIVKSVIPDICWVTLIRNTDVSKAFGSHLAKLRKKKGFSQRELAFASNVEISQISRIERGLLNPTLSTLYTIAMALEIPLGKLCSFDVEV